MKNKLWSDHHKIFKSLLCTLSIFIVILIMFYIGINTTKVSSQKQTEKVMYDSINKAIIQCYAIEGMYPPSIEYLEKNYGLIIDHKNYIVHYEAFASNVLPTVAIISLQEE